MSKAGDSQQLEKQGKAYAVEQCVDCIAWETCPTTIEQMGTIGVPVLSEVVTS